MAKAKKLPSGSWRCLVYDYTDGDGKRHYKSFTSDDSTAQGKRDAEFEAAEYARTKEKQTIVSSSTLKNAIVSYIKAKENVLSPSTIRGYKVIQNVLENDYTTFLDVSIGKLDNKTYQLFINQISQSKSPKTVRNYNGLLTAVLAENGVSIKTSLPKKIRPSLYIPSDDDIKRILDETKGTDLEIPILLAAFGPMRRGEICALDSNHINGNIVHVEFNVVMNPERKWVIKAPKSYSGDRYIEFPDFVAEKLKSINGKVTNLEPNYLTEKFGNMIRRIDIPQFRFHDLRHYSASMQHALGIPDAYIMQRGGWGNDSVLKGIYRHALDSEQKRINGIINEHFSDICNTECNTKK
jgi:integrase